MNVWGESLGVYLERHGPLCSEEFALLASRVLFPIAELHARGQALGIIDPSEIMLHPCASKVHSVHLLRSSQAYASEDLSADVIAIGALFELMLYGRYTLPYGVPYRLLTLIGRCTRARQGPRPCSAAEVLEELIDIMPAACLIPSPNFEDVEPGPPVPKPLRPGLRPRLRSPK